MAIHGTEDWGVGDWRNDEEYPEDPLTVAKQGHINMAGGVPLGKAAVRQCLWRWEFLRRSSEYREDWQRMSGRDVIHSEKYGLFYCFPDPREARPFPLFFADTLGMVSDQVPRVSLVLDLSRPIKPQFRAAEQTVRIARHHLLEEIGDEGLKNVVKRRCAHPREWPELLRALDARAAKATFREIGEVLRGKEDYADASTYGQRLVARARRIQAYLAPIVPDLGDSAFTFKTEA